MDDEVEATDITMAEIRPDWWVPASIVMRTTGHVIAAVAGGCIHMADTFVGYSNYGDGRLEFHNAAAAELESIIEESDGE